MASSNEPAAFDESSFGALEARVEKALEEYREEHRKLSSHDRDFQQLQDTLRTIDGKVKHEVLVPLGSMAFAPGHLVHTNEITVLLGEDIFAVRTAKQAIDIAQRRREFIQKEKKRAEESMRVLLERLEYSAKFSGESRVYREDGVVEIREEYDEKQHAPKPKKTAKQAREEEEEYKKDADEVSSILERFAKLERERDAEGDEDEEEYEEDEEYEQEEDEVEEEEEEGNMVDIEEFEDEEESPVFKSPADIFNRAAGVIPLPAAAASASAASASSQPQRLPQSSIIEKGKAPVSQPSQVPIQPASVPAKPILKQQPSSFSAMSAFSGSIVERGSNPMEISPKTTPAIPQAAATAPAATPAEQPRVSKFKAARMGQ